MTTLYPHLAYAMWSAKDHLWQASWTATACQTRSDVPKSINIIFACHTAPEISKCPHNTAYAITVTEYNSTLAPWNPDSGAIRWNVELGGIGTSVSWNFTFDDDDSKLLAKRADLHISILTVDKQLSSATAALYSFSDGDDEWQSCQLWDVNAEDNASCHGTNSMFLSKTSINLKRQYTLVFNATEPRNTYEIVAHVTAGSARKGSNIWIFVAVAVACFVVGAIIAGICSAFFWHGDRDKEREPFVRDQLIR